MNSVKYIPEDILNDALKLFPSTEYKRSLYTNLNNSGIHTSTIHF